MSERFKTYTHAGLEPPLFHWRAASGHDVDIIIDLGTQLLPVEVKSGATVPSDAMAHLRWWGSLPGNTNEGGLLVYGGTDREQRQGYTILPWYML